MRRPSWAQWSTATAAGVGNHTNTGVGNVFDLLRSGHGYGDRPVWNVRWSTPGMWSTRWVDATNGELIHEGLAVA